MSRFVRGLSGQMVALLTLRRHRILLLLFLGASWASMEIYHGAVVTDLPVAVLDADNSRASRTIRLALESTRDVRVLDVTPAGIEDAASMVSTGQATAVLVIPADFSTDIKHGRHGRVLLAVDMSNILIGKIAAKAVSRILATVNVGLEMTTLQRMGERAAAARSHMAPLVIDESFAFNPTTSYAAYMAPVLTFFFLHLMTLILGCSIGLPPAPARSLLEAGGRATAVVLVMIAGAILLMYVFLPCEHVVMRSGPAVLIVIAAASAVAIVCMAAAALTLAPRRLTGFQVALLAGMLSMMLSGATWPSDALPPLLRHLAQGLPFTPLTRGLRTIIPQAATIADVLPVLEQLGLQCAGWGAAAALALVVRRAVRGARPDESAEESPC